MWCHGSACRKWCQSVRRSSSPSNGQTQSEIVHWEPGFPGFVVKCAQQISKVKHIEGNRSAVKDGFDPETEFCDFLFYVESLLLIYFSLPVFVCFPPTSPHLIAGPVLLLCFTGLWIWWALLPVSRLKTHLFFISTPRLSCVWVPFLQNHTRLFPASFYWSPACVPDDDPFSILCWWVQQAVTSVQI